MPELDQRLRILGLSAPAAVTELPQIGRALQFALTPGPAVLLTTPERLSLFSLPREFGVTLRCNPGLHQWESRGHLVMDVLTATEPFSDDPAAEVLALLVGSSYPRDVLAGALERLGYPAGGEPGYSLSGDRLVVSLADGSRLRAEFFGDEMDGLRLWKAGSEVGERIERWVIAPRGAADGLGRGASRLQNFPGTVFLDAPAEYQRCLGSLLPELWSQLEGRDLIAFGRTPLPLPVVASGCRPLAYYRARLSRAVEDLRRWAAEGWRILLVLRHHKTAEYFRAHFPDLPLTERSSLELPPGRIQLVIGPGEGGFLQEGSRLVVLTEDLLYGFQGGTTRLAKTGLSRTIPDPQGLQVGDYLIHPEHGIGRFEGLETREVLGVRRDYLQLRYAGEAKIYLPIDLLPIMRRHSGTTDEPPKLSSLGRGDWQRVKERAKVDAEQVAAKMLVHYARRQLAPGYPHTPLPDWDPLIEAGFGYRLTRDQQLAWSDVDQDLASPHPMDRLISGDVGFGKTEVAIRAAHRVVGHGRQAIVFVPTTLLAEQHAETFRQRFADLPVRVAGLSRFTAERQAQEILADFSAGQIDILIGTHRLLSSDVRPARLGLLVIDEEHRFGVEQKERLREMTGVDLSRADQDLGDLKETPTPDALSLSATPIPRTLYMSLVGLRDLSSIQTPPEGRKPIHTILTTYDPMAVRDAVLSEMDRGGRCFYIHDRVASMPTRALYLQRLIPEARFGLAHGQMPEAQLEEIMADFDRGAFDVLISTTIVESGLDIPLANTILIERADRLGLAQLYQLRGRVGRRDLGAFAYLFYPPKVTSSAVRRLAAIEDLQDLDSGHLVAERDMEIRGVGNLLGAEQHGHIQAVTLEVYTELLAEAVAQLKGEPRAEPPPSVVIDLPVEARLTVEYFGDEVHQVAAYGQLGEVRSLPALRRLERSWQRSFGPLPLEVASCVALTRLRLLAAQKRVASISAGRTQLEVQFRYRPLDYDASALRRFPYPVKILTYPPAATVERAALSPSLYLEVLSDLLTCFA